MKGYMAIQDVDAEQVWDDVLKAQQATRTPKD
jgi:hypothetical protein